MTSEVKLRQPEEVSKTPLSAYAATEARIQREILAENRDRLERASSGRAVEEKFIAGEVVQAPTLEEPEVLPPTENPLEALAEAFCKAYTVKGEVVRGEDEALNELQRLDDTLAQSSLILSQQALEKTESLIDSRKSYENYAKECEHREKLVNDIFGGEYGSLIMGGIMILMALPSMGSSLMGWAAEMGLVAAEEGAAAGAAAGAADAAAVAAEESSAAAANALCDEEVVQAGCEAAKSCKAASFFEDATFEARESWKDAQALDEFEGPYSGKNPANEPDFLSDVDPAEASFDELEAEAQPAQGQVAKNPAADNAPWYTRARRGYNKLSGKLSDKADALSKYADNKVLYKGTHVTFRLSHVTGFFGGLLKYGACMWLTSAFASPEFMRANSEIGLFDGSGGLAAAKRKIADKEEALGPIQALQTQVKFCMRYFQNASERQSDIATNLMQGLSQVVTLSAKTFDAYRTMCSTIVHPV